MKKNVKFYNLLKVSGFIKFRLIMLKLCCNVDNYRDMLR